MCYILRHNSSLTMTAIIFFHFIKGLFYEHTNTKRTKRITTSVKC